MTPGLQVAFDDNPPVSRRTEDLPTIYDGIYRAGVAYGMTNQMIKQLIRMLASDVDFQSQLRRPMSWKRLFSLPANWEKAGDKSEILYVAANFGGDLKKFYRFHSKDGNTDYYDEDGRAPSSSCCVNRYRTASPFTLRHAASSILVIPACTRVWTGQLRVERQSSLQAMASSNERVGPTAMATRRIIRHSNGYESSYSHQNAIASGVIRVRRCGRARL